VSAFLAWLFGIKSDHKFKFWKTPNGVSHFGVCVENVESNGQLFHHEIYEHPMQMFLDLTLYLIYTPMYTFVAVDILKRCENWIIRL